MKAAANDTTISDIVNNAVRNAFDEDAEDLEAIRQRRHEPDLALEDVIRSLKRRGKL